MQHIIKSELEVVNRKKDLTRVTMYVYMYFKKIHILGFALAVLAASLTLGYLIFAL